MSWLMRLPAVVSGLFLGFSLGAVRIAYAESIHVRYVPGHVSCPGLEALERKIAARNDDAVFVAPAQAQRTFEVSPGDTVLTLRVLDAEGQLTWSREVQDPDCSDRINAAALIIALAVNRSQASQEESTGEEKPVRAAPEASMRSREELAGSVGKRGAAERHLTLDIGGRWVHALAPPQLFAVELGVSFLGRGAFVSSGRLGLAHAPWRTGASGVRVRWSAVTAAFGIVRWRQALEISLDGQAQLGVLDAQFEVRERLPWASVGSELRVALEFAPGWRVSVAGGLSLPFWRHHYWVGSNLVHRIPWILPSGSAWLSVPLLEWTD